MALTPYTPRQVQLIKSSFRKVFETGEIEYLSNLAYKFLNLSSGFIAHYNLYGFRDYYSDVEMFKAYILQCQGMNQWRNFRPGERDYEYMMQKRDIYNDICKLITA